MPLTESSDAIYSPGHRLLFNSRYERSNYVSMTRRAMGLIDMARHLIRCDLIATSSDAVQLQTQGFLMRVDDEARA
jgi:hypothetical protein